MMMVVMMVSKGTRRMETRVRVIAKRMQTRLEGKDDTKGSTEGV